MENNINANSLDSLLCYVGVRNKNLGTTLTDKQLNAIANGDMSDLWNGDYWENNGIKWRIVDNTSAFYNYGNTSFTKQHLVVMPDTNLLSGDALMNDTNTTNGGYNNTKYRSTYRSQCKTLFAKCFGEGSILTHKELLSNSTSNGQVNGWLWVDADVEIPSECNMYGHNIFSQSTDTNGGGGYNIGVNHSQFALFRLYPRFICTGSHYWCREVANSTDFAAVGDNGQGNHTNAANSLIGLRPYAIIGKA